MTIQLMALPVNRPNKDTMSELNTKCILGETSTGTLIKFDAKFDYSRRGSAHDNVVMDAAEIWKIGDGQPGQELNFRVMVMIDRSRLVHV